MKIVVVLNEETLQFGAYVLVVCFCLRELFSTYFCLFDKDKSLNIVH